MMQSVADRMLSTITANVFVRFVGRGYSHHGLRPVIGVRRVVPAKANKRVRLLVASLR